MTWTQSPAGRAVLILAAVVAVVLAAPFALKAADFHGPLWLRLVLALALVVPPILAIRHYWLSIDEAAREAQKWAWFWGGQFGLAFGLVLLVLAVRAAPSLAALAPPAASQAQAMVYGAFALVIAQLTGFTLAWAFWWVRRR